MVPLTPSPALFHSSSASQKHSFHSQPHLQDGGEQIADRTTDCHHHHHPDDGWISFFLETFSSFTVEFRTLFTLLTFSA
ncbi:hypothetical protein CEXT_302031 [Caerostris extrusa]|uniref:Uncharacterized protein n=1 Tax=Caerostris extrusa TaxID=172846 RepID=A0AAV4VJD9_CAEEX|nr:hypothetical protein CEXT_302031 [Caerostris extrusa]